MHEKVRELLRANLFNRIYSDEGNNHYFQQGHERMRWDAEKLKPVIIFAHCSDPFKEDKLNHLEKLIDGMDKSKYFVLLYANSDIPSEITNKATYYMHDSKNWFYPHYSFALHMKIVLAINVLAFHGFTKALAMEYDAPLGCQDNLWQRFEGMTLENPDLKLIGHDWGPSAINQSNWFADIQFMLDNIPFANFGRGVNLLSTGMTGDQYIYQCLLCQDLMKHVTIFMGDDYWQDSSWQKFQAGGTLMKIKDESGTYKYIKEDGSDT